MKAALEQIVEKGRVLDDADLLGSFGADRSFAPPLKPRLVVRPRDAGQVREIVKWANETGTTLVPVSSGRPHFRGDTVPSAPNAVIVDLGDMKRILSVNRTHRMVVVEPGVTYGELQGALAKEGMTLSTPLAPRATKSVLASVLEVEPRLNCIHQWSYQDPLRCTEVVWGDGVRMFTGEAGGAPADLARQWETEKWQVSGTGPFMFDFHRLLTSAQGTMGIATWASLKCEVLPQIHRLYFVPSESLPDLIDVVYAIIRPRFSDELFITSGGYLAALLADGTGGTDRAGEAARLARALPPWVALVGIAGRELLPEERVGAHEQSISDIVRAASHTMVATLAGVSGRRALEKATYPSGPDYWKEAAKGAFQEIFFVTTMDRVPRFLAAMREQAIGHGFPVEDIGVYIQPQHMGTSCHLEFLLPYDPGSTTEDKRMRALFDAASRRLSGMGAYFSRPYGTWSRLQLNRDAQSYMTTKKLKGIFDPRNVMNTGKLGI